MLAFTLFGSTTPPIPFAVRQLMVTFQMRRLSQTSMCLSVSPKGDLGMCHWQQRGSAADEPRRCLGSAMDPTASVESRMHPGATGDGPTVSPAKSQAVFRAGRAKRRHVTSSITSQSVALARR